MRETKVAAYRPIESYFRHVVAQIVKLFAVLLACGLAAPGHAKQYPDAPVNVVMPWLDGFPANSARIYSQWLSDRYKQSFVVQPKPGAGGEVAAKHVIHSDPSGYTLLVTGSSITIRGVSSPENADGERDLQPIAQLTTSPYVIVARAGKYKTFKNFLAIAKANPGKLNFASAGVGTGMHYLGELINASADVQIMHIPYSSGGKELQAVLGGDVDVAIISLVTALPQIQAGALEALAVSSTERSKVAPNVPTLVESGLKNIPSIGAWIAMFGPKGMRPEIVHSLASQIKAIAADPVVVEKVSSWGAEIPDTDTSHLVDVIRTEKTLWSKLIKERHLPTVG